MHKKLLKDLKVKLDLYKKLSHLNENAETNSTKYYAAVQYRLLEEDLKQLENRYNNNRNLKSMLAYAHKAGAKSYSVSRGMSLRYEGKPMIEDLKIHRARQIGLEKGQNYVIVNGKRFKV